MMSFDVLFAKPAGRELDDNRIWLDSFLGRFPEFQTETVDLMRCAQELASDIGLTPDGYVHRGIGVAAEFDIGEFWMRIGFWDSLAILELPNFPEPGIEHAIRQVAPILQFLASLGFVLLDPASEEPVQGDTRAFLRAAYAERQERVNLVATITGGKPG